MKPERYVLTTSTDTRSSQQIWDSSRPLGIGHPFRWILERTADGVRLRDLSAPTTSSWVTIPFDKFAQGEKLQLKPGVELSVKPIRPPKAAYLSIVRDAPSNEPSRLLAFAGVRHWITNCDAVHSAYVGYQR